MNTFTNIFERMSCYTTKEWAIIKSKYENESIVNINIYFITFSINSRWLYFILTYKMQTIRTFSKNIFLPQQILLFGRKKISILTLENIFPRYSIEYWIEVSCHIDSRSNTLLMVALRIASSEIHTQIEFVNLSSFTT